MGRRFSSSEPAQILRCSLVKTSTEILANSARQIGEGARQLARLQRTDQNVTGADLRFAEEQSRVMPTAVKQVHDGIGDRRHLGFVLAEAVDDRR